MREEKSCILYVDDEENNLLVFKSTFKYEYKILTASSAREGLEVLRNNEVSLIITDQKMPEVNGVEFLKKAIKEFPDVTRMILTGYSDLDSISAAINECGIFRYLTKPWNEPDMKLAIDKALESFNLKKDIKQLIEKLEDANKGLEEKVSSRTAELIRLNDEKNQLLEIVAHDLKSPLNNQTGLINVIEKDAELVSERQQYCISLIKQLNGKMISMVNKILQSENIEKANLKSSPQLTDLKVIIENQVSQFREQADAKSITLILEIKEEDTSLHIDQDFLNQVLDNLISNAIKFSPANKSIFVRLHKQDEVFKIVVEDQGPGIRQDEQDKLFLKYKKLSAAPTNNESSTGLGLSLVKKYIKLLNGKVWCESEPGKGATFIVELPREDMVISKS
jgi:two-component system, sensor histidine kinase and response regulator